LQPKGATDALTRVLATMAKYGTTVNAIAPTTFRLKLTERMWGTTTSAGRVPHLVAYPAWAARRSGDLVGMAIYLPLAGVGFLHRPGHMSMAVSPLQRMSRKSGCPFR
jgi:NAD(P)-dependent dehydrogenase (short-subunit alcohol dehydrogenase family)